MTLKMYHYSHILFEFKTSFLFVGAISKMGNVVIRAPRRLQDINSVILPRRRIPRANRGGLISAGDSPPTQYPMSPPLPHRYGMSTDSVFALLPNVCALPSDHFQEVQIFLSSFEGHCCVHIIFRFTNIIKSDLS